MKLILNWLHDGALPMIMTESQKEIQYIHHSNEVENPTSEWLPARAGRNGRFLIPLADISMDGFLQFLEQTPIPEGTLYLTLRSSFDLSKIDPINDPERWIVIGGGVFLDTFDGDVFDGDIDTIRQFLTINDETEEPSHPALVQPWRNIQQQKLDHKDDKERHAEEHKRFLAAQKRSLSLLMSQLDDDQQKELRKHKRFTMVAKDERTYVITYCTHGNVWLMDGDTPIANYCIVSEELPTYDQMLGQKLMLETDPDDFAEIANITKRESAPRGPAIARDPWWAKRPNAELFRPESDSSRRWGETLDGLSRDISREEIESGNYAVITPGGPYGTGLENIPIVPTDPDATEPEPPEDDVTLHPLIVVGEGGNTVVMR